MRTERERVCVWSTCCFPVCVIWGVADAERPTPPPFHSFIIGNFKRTATCICVYNMVSAQLKSVAARRSHLICGRTWIWRLFNCFRQGAWGFRFHTEPLVMFPQSFLQSTKMRHVHSRRPIFSFRKAGCRTGCWGSLFVICC